MSGHVKLLNAGKFSKLGNLNNVRYFKVNLCYNCTGITKHFLLLIEYCIFRQKQIQLFCLYFYYIRCLLSVETKYIVIVFAIFNSL